MHSSILKLINTHSDRQHVSANYVAIFKEVIYKLWIYSSLQNKIAEVP